MENKTELVKRIREMEASLEKMAVATENGDRAELESIMRHACAQKLKWLEEKE